MATITTLCMFLSCSLIILHLHTNSILIAYSQQPQAPLPALLGDSKGEFMYTGISYYIQPVSPPGRTIGLSSAPNRDCPLDVILQPPGAYAIPVKFSVVDGKDNEPLFYDNDMNIIFDVSTACGTSNSSWRMEPASTDGGKTTTYFVEIGGEKGNPGIETLFSWFNIRDVKTGNGYQNVINFCPSVCSTCKPVCGNIGLIVDNDGRTRLGITSGAPLPVKFVKTGF